METNGAKHGTHGLEGDGDLKFLQQGGTLVKVRSRSWQKSRYYKLQEDCKTMWHESGKTFRKKQTFTLDDIESLRKGRQTERLQKYTHPSTEDRCFSIIFKDHHKLLDLMAGSEDDATKWTNGLEKIMNNMKGLSRQKKREHWIFNCMRKADKNEDNQMTLKELKHFLRQINVEVDDTYAEQLFKECDKSNSGTLEGPEIKHYYDLLTHREEIDVIYKKYAEEDGEMSARDLLHFLQSEQREQVTLGHAVRLINKYEVDETAKQTKHMTKDGFLMYMQHEEGSILVPTHSRVHQDMHQPLNHYYISSSHNTYLTADQLKGPSSIEAYIRALTKGCRCVELDCWDGANGEPVIYHGYTLTSKVLFRDVIKAIKDYAFQTSEYPVILSLENHCTVPQQKIMAHHMVSILGEALVTRPFSDTMQSLPSPEGLKGKFLIKGKRLNNLSNNNSVDMDSVSEEDEAADTTKENGAKGKAKKGKIKLAKELSDLVVYCKSVHFGGFEHAKDTQTFYEMSSLKEGKAFALAEASGTAFLHHNMDKLTRIYPAGSRTDSSNYNPVPMWNSGCQIVALNFQTPCREMDLNQGRFLANGSCGYTLKPEFQRDLSSHMNPRLITKGPWLQKKTLHVMIISAQQLPKVNTEKHSSIVDPLVRVELWGLAIDNASQQTQYIQNNGFNPMWNESFQFLVHVPELAMLRFVVEDYDSTSQNDLVGQYCLPLTSIQNGYRHVPLLTKRGDVICSAGIFVHVMLVDTK